MVISYMLHMNQSSPKLDVNFPINHFSYLTETKVLYKTHKLLF